MIWSVPLIDGSAARATLACIARINIDDRDTSARGLVGDKCAKLSKGPIMQAVAIFAAGRNPCADMRQLFQRNAAQGAFSINHNSLRNYVVCVFLKPRLFARQFLETTLSRLCSALLKPGAALGGLPSSAFDFVARVNLSIARGGERNNAEIDSKPIGGFETFSLGNIACAGKQPFSAHEAQINLSLAEGKQVALMLAGDELELYTAFDCPDRNRIVALETENTVVIGLCGVGAKNRSDVAVDLERIGDLGDAANGSLSSQIEIDASIGIGELVDVKLAEDAISKTVSRDSRTSLVTAFQRRPKDGGLVERRQELDGCDELHNFKYRGNPASMQAGSGAFLPGLNAGVSSAENR